jgi:PHD/YefM family antitoxin component YafN of YafNO toxin-antitoxin module
MLDLDSLAEFQANARDRLAKLRETGEPLLLTVDGKAELVVQDAASYQQLLARIDRLEAIVGIRSGMKDYAEGHVTSFEDFAAAKREKHGL